MLQLLKKYFLEVLPFSTSELSLLDEVVEVRVLRKNQLLLKHNSICNFVAFIAAGTIRHFHVKDGIERTCDISVERNWVTDFTSFNELTPGKINLQAMEETTVILIKKDDLVHLYKQSSRFESFGRLMAEQVAQRATDIAMSLSADKPEARFKNLLATQPDLFLRLPQKYIANFLGILPESLSRIKQRIMQQHKL